MDRSAAFTTEDATNGATDSRRSPVRRWLVAAWASLVVIGITVGAFTHLHFRADQVERAEADARIVARLGADNVSAWIDQRESDAQVMVENTGYTIRVRDYFLDPANKVNTEAVVSRLLGEHRYRGFSYLQLFDPSGAFRLGVPDSRTDDPADRAAVMRAFANPGQIEIGKARRAPDDRVEVPIIAALGGPGPDGEVVYAVCVFYADLSTNVFPLLERWPGVTRTGEVLLVRPDDTGYDILSPRRFGGDVAGPILRVPYAADQSGLLPLHSAERGATGSVDYRGVSVLTVFEPVTGTPWVVQAKVDAEEVRAPATTHLLYTIAIVVLWACVVSLGAGLIWRSRMFEYELARARVEYAETKAADLGELNLELARANAVKSAFLASMSHELRTPLNSIIGFSGILAKGMAGPMNDEQQAQVEMIGMSGRHLLSLIEDVLDLSKIEARKVERQIEPLDPAAIALEIIESVRPLANEKGLELRIDVPPTGLELRSDCGKVRQILLNLLGNAVKFTDAGFVALTLRRGEDGAAIFVVEDSGSGIPSADLDRVFDAFVQLPTSSRTKPKGTGLGLKLAQEYALLLGGKITVQSTLGQGSAFTLTVPNLDD